MGADLGDMMATCKRALELGLPALAFTDHADFTSWTHGPTDAAHPHRVVGAGRSGHFDAGGYWECFERCQAAFPQLRLKSGIELGEPHMFRDQANTVLGSGPFQQILGSLHCVDIDGTLVDLNRSDVLRGPDRTKFMRRYLNATQDLIDSDVPFTTLAHIDYPQRYWGNDQRPFDVCDFEEEYRELLRHLAQTGRALEVNTRIGAHPTLLRWWVDAGGQTVCFGSDAHTPDAVAAGFTTAAPIVEAVGFHPVSDPTAPWQRRSGAAR